MATLVLAAVGTAVGGPIGGAIGAVLGQGMDARLFAPKPREGPRLGDLAVQTSNYGNALPKLFGTMRVAGTVIWATDLIERRTTSSNGKGRPKNVDYSYAANFAVALSARPVREVRRIWADGKLLRGAGGDWKSRTGFRLHLGDEDQEPDPLIVAAEGVGQAPAFRGLAYAVFEEMELADFGNRIPMLTFEIVADAGPVAIGAMAAKLAPELVDKGETPHLGGYAVSGDSVRSALEELAELTGLGLVESGADVSLAIPAEPAVALARSGEAKQRELMRRSAGSVPVAVTLTYYEPARDYQAGLQKAAAGAPVPDALVERRSLAAALSAEEAKALAERRLDRLWAERVSASVTFGWARADVRPGRLVTLEGEAGLWRVRRWILGDMKVTLELVRFAAGVAVAGAASPGRPVSEADLPHGPTTLRLYDLPLAEAAGDRPTLVALAAGSQAGWRRANLSVSYDDGVSWEDAGTTAAPAVLGEALTVLPPGGSALFDLAAAVEVQLLDDEMLLVGRDKDALVAGANLALVGDELVQFGDAELLGEGRYRLSRLLRGRRGTEWAMANHVAGEEFALIEAASARPITLPAGMAAGTEVRLLASGVGDAEPAAAVRIAAGEALRPPGPVHLSAAAVEDGGVAISWVRRSRLGWSWASGSDTPLGEEVELYAVTLTGAFFSREVEVSAPSFTYDAAARAADGTGPVLVSVVQLGTHGRSRAASIIID
jgi:hypothetical protein